MSNTKNETLRENQEVSDTPQDPIDRTVDAIRQAVHEAAGGEKIDLPDMSPEEFANALLAGMPDDFFETEESVGGSNERVEPANHNNADDVSSIAFTTSYATVDRKTRVNQCLAETFRDLEIQCDLEVQQQILAEQLRECIEQLERQREEQRELFCRLKVDELVSGDEEDDFVRLEEIDFKSSQPVSIAIYGSPGCGKSAIVNSIIRGQAVFMNAVESETDIELLEDDHSGLMLLAQEKVPVRCEWRDSELLLDKSPLCIVVDGFEHADEESQKYLKRVFENSSNDERLRVFISSPTADLSNHRRELANAFFQLRDVGAPERASDGKCENLKSAALQFEDCPAHALRAIDVGSRAGKITAAMRFQEFNWEEMESLPPTITRGAAHDWDGWSEFIADANAESTDAFLRQLNRVAWETFHLSKFHQWCRFVRTEVLENWLFEGYSFVNSAASKYAATKYIGPVLGIVLRRRILAQRVDAAENSLAKFWKRTCDLLCRNESFVSEKIRTLLAEPDLFTPTTNLLTEIAEEEDRLAEHLESIAEKLCDLTQGSTAAQSQWDWAIDTLHSLARERKRASSDNPATRIVAVWVPGVLSANAMKVIRPGAMIDFDLKRKNVPPNEPATNIADEFSDEFSREFCEGLSTPCSRETGVTLSPRDCELRRLLGEGNLEGRSGSLAAQTMLFLACEHPMADCIDGVAPYVVASAEHTTDRVAEIAGLHEKIEVLAEEGVRVLVVAKTQEKQARRFAPSHMVVVSSPDLAKELVDKQLVRFLKDDDICRPSSTDNWWSIWRRPKTIERSSSRGFLLYDADRPILITGSVPDKTVAGLILPTDCRRTAIRSELFGRVATSANPKRRSRTARVAEVVGKLWSSIRGATSTCASTLGELKRWFQKVALAKFSQARDESTDASFESEHFFRAYVFWLLSFRLKGSSSDGDAWFHSDFCKAFRHKDIPNPEGLRTNHTNLEPMAPRMIDAFGSPPPWSSTT